MLEAKKAIAEVNRAIRMGAALFLPCGGLVEKTAQTRVEKVTERGEIKLQSERGTSYMAHVALDYRLRSLLIQADAYIKSIKPRRKKKR